MTVPRRLVHVSRSRRAVSAAIVRQAGPAAAAPRSADRPAHVRRALRLAISCTYVYMTSVWIWKIRVQIRIRACVTSSSRQIKLTDSSLNSAFLSKPHLRRVPALSPLPPGKVSSRFISNVREKYLSFLIAHSYVSFSLFLPEVLECNLFCWGEVR